MKKHSLILTLLVLLSFPWEETGAQAQQMVFINDSQLHAAQAVQTSQQKRTELKDVLKSLQQEYKVFFTYSDEIVKNKKILFEYRPGQKLETVLERILYPLGLKYQKVRGKFYVITKGKKAPDRMQYSRSEEKATSVAPPRKARFAPLPKLSSNRTTHVDLFQFPVTGTVTDQAGEPLIGVNILVKGSSRGTVSDLDGSFSLELETGEETLVFSYTGYETMEVPVNERSELQVTMAESVSELEEVVVVGYGTVQKRDLTGAVGSLEAEKFEGEVISNVSQGLQGKVAGVNVTTNGGAPGGAMIVRIRGNNSVIGGNDPLYVIDGFPVTSGNIGETDLLATINPGDIESIEVLKDASATAIYGSRGSNGVVLITTKQGRAGVDRIDIETSVGTRSVARTLDMMNSAQFLEIANERALNDGNEPFFSPQEVSELSQINTDWQEEIFRQAMVQNHTLRFTGGNENTRYLVSANYFDEEGIIIGSDFKRGSLRFNLDKNFGERFELSTRVSLSRSINNEVPANNIMLSALQAPPFLSPYNEDGSYVFGTDLKDFPFSPSAGTNPVSLALEQLNRRVIDRVLANVAGSYEILNGLVFKAQLGIDQLNNNRDLYNPSTIEAGIPAGSGSKSFGTTTSLLSENTLNYNTTFPNDDRLSVTVGFTWQEESNEFLSGSASGFVTDDLQNDALGSGQFFGAPNTSLSDWTLLSFLGRINYSLNDRYLFTLSGRRDGSSRFGEGNKWGFFPSAAFAWRLSEENFIRNILPSSVSDLKLRASWGISGNQAISPFQSLQRFSDVGLAFGGTVTTGFRPENLGNPDLQWETTREFNLGLEFGMWNQRLSFSADYYVKNTEDLLALVNLPPTSGFSTTIQNIGSTRNQGVELNLAGVILRKGNMRWDANFNISANRNEVTETATGQDIVGPGIEIVGPANVVREGEPLSSFFGLEVDGLTDDGFFNYVDQNGDGNINDADRVILGNPYPDFFYGFSTEFTLGDFSLRMNFQGEIGKQIWFMDIYRFGASMHRGGNSFAEVATQRWTPQNPDPNAKYPRATQTLNQQPSEFYLAEADYLRLQNLRLSYNIPVNALNWGTLNNATVYLSGQNLFTITPYPGYTPDIDTFSSGDLRIGVDYRSYPIPRSLMLGLKVGF